MPLLMPASATAVTNMSRQSGLANILDDMSFNGLLEDCTTLKSMSDLKAASASQNFKAFQEKVYPQISHLQQQASGLRAAGDVQQALALELQSMQLQAGSGEWKGAADMMGHR